MSTLLTTEQNASEWNLGDTLVHKKFGFKVKFICLTTDIEQFRAFGDFQFSVKDFKKVGQ